MTMSIVTLPMDTDSVSFSEEALNAAVGKRPVQALAFHMMKVEGRPHLVVVFQAGTKKQAQRTDWRATLAAGDYEVFEALRAWRNKKAAGLNQASYLLASNKTLADLAVARPADAAALLAVKGIGSKKLEQHGDGILATIADAVAGLDAASPAGEHIVAAEAAA